MTQKELVLEYIKEYGELTPAKQHGVSYKGGYLGSELSRRCRELRAEGKLASRGEGKFEVYFLPSNTEKPLINDSVASQPKARGWAYYPPESKVCCEIYKASKGYAHARGCETHK